MLILGRGCSISTNFHIFLAFLLLTFATKSPSREIGLVLQLIFLFHSVLENPKLRKMTSFFEDCQEKFRKWFGSPKRIFFHLRKDIPMEMWSFRSTNNHKGIQIKIPRTLVYFWWTFRNVEKFGAFSRYSRSQTAQENPLLSRYIFPL